LADKDSSVSQAQAPRSDSSTSFESRSDKSNETAITSIHESFIDPKSGRLYGEIIQRVASQQRKDAESMQSSASFRKRAMWIAKDREDYKTIIRAITESNDLIERLVRNRALKCLNSVAVGEDDGGKTTYQHQIMPAKANGSALPALPSKENSCIKVLSRLHGALIQSKKSKEGKVMAKSHFGFKASLDHSLTKENLLADFEELPFRVDSQVHLLQTLKASNPSESTLLVSESLVEPSLVQVTLQVPNDDLDPFVHLGDFSATPSDTHRLYMDSTPWVSITSLQDLIGLTEKPPSPAIRYRLAALLATTHLHSTGLSYTPGQLHPENFKYFDIPSEAGSFALGEMLEDEDRLLSLYYFSGIGSSRPKISTRSIGAFRGTTPMFDVATTELGLLLYQIGSWQRLEYGKSSSTVALEKLRGVVKQRIHELHREAGLRYAETVEKCLEWRHKSTKEREAELPRLYDEIVKSLRDLDEEIRIGSFDVISPHGESRLKNSDEVDRGDLNGLTDD